MLSKNEEIGVFIVVTTGLILLLIGFIILILFLYKRKQLNFYKNLELLKNDYEKSLLSAQLEIQEQTLQHISREIHDNIGHSLTFVKLSLNTILWQNKGDIADKMSVSVDRLSKAMNDLRYLSKTMSYDFIALNGLPQALQLEIEQIKRLNLYTVRWEINGEPKPLGAKREVMIFRIVQEALNNSIKHAGPTELGIQIRYTDTYLQIEVYDNGKGGIGGPEDQARLNGSGLKNMQHRTRQLNGTYKIDNNHPSGTKIHVTIPIEA